jgi:hypothetical protein
MRNDLRPCLHAAPTAKADSPAPYGPVGIDERSSPVPAIVALPSRRESRDHATSQQAAQIEIWEEEGGTTS